MRDRDCLGQSLRGGGSGRSRPASTMRFRSVARSGNRSTTWSRHRHWVVLKSGDPIPPLKQDRLNPRQPFTEFR